jgi:uncharacterized protein YjbJ (UPF0337 family)
MTNERIEGVGHQIRGAVKEMVGKLIGDVKLRHDGAAERQGGEVQCSAAAVPAQVAGVDTDRILGVGHQLEGMLTENIGHVLGNPSLEASGRAERAAGRLQNAAGAARDEAREALQAARPPIEIEKRPPTIEIEKSSPIIEIERR